MMVTHQRSGLTTPATAPYKALPRVGLRRPLEMLTQHPHFVYLLLDRGVYSRDRVQSELVCVCVYRNKRQGTWTPCKMSCSPPILLAMWLIYYVLSRPHVSLWGEWFVYAAMLFAAVSACHYICLLRVICMFPFLSSYMYKLTPVCIFNFQAFY